MARLSVCSSRTRHLQMFLHLELDSSTQAESLLQRMGETDLSVEGSRLGQVLRSVSELESGQVQWLVPAREMLAWMDRAFA